MMRQSPKSSSLLLSVLTFLSAAAPLTGIQGSPAFSLLPTAQAAPVPASAFESILAREFLIGTRTGATLIGRITETAVSQVSDGVYRSFLQRMAWSEMSPLAEELAYNLRSLDDEFRAYRVAKGLPGELRAGEVISLEEREFLEKAAERLLKTTKLENLLLETRQFVEIPRAERLGSPRTGAAATRVAQGPEVPEVPNPDSPDFSILNRTFVQKIQHRFKLYRNFVRALQLTEGDWRNLFTQAGKPFTVQDWIILRKYNRLFDVLNEHARMRLIFKAFAQERPALYARLNERTAQETTDYLEGVLSDSDYLAARARVATELKMNGIVGEAETRMLTAVRRCKELAGGHIDGSGARSLIDISEDNLRSIQRSSAELRTQVQADEAQMKLLNVQLREASDAAKTAIREQIVRVERGLGRKRADLDLWAEREKLEVRELQKMYLQFIESFDAIELFANLRRGRINSEEVQAFNLPDSFIPPAAEVRVWQEFYDRALYNSTNALVLNETKLYFKSAVGETRTFVRKMNTLTGQYFGKRFTESALGQEFLQYNRHIATEVLLRVGQVLGVTIPPGLATFYSDRIWNFVFSLNEDEAARRSDPATGDDPTPDANSGSSTRRTESDRGNRSTPRPSRSSRPAPSASPVSGDPDEDLESGLPSTSVVRPGGIEAPPAPEETPDSSSRPTGIR